MSDNKTGGEIIRELRMKKGLTIKQFGEIVNTNYVFLSKLERNLEKPSEELIKNMANALNYEGDINTLIASFGRIPKEIEKILLEDPSSMIELPAFYKKRKKR